MISNIKPLSIKVQRAGSFFLVLIFLLASAAQLIHTHPDQPETTSYKQHKDKEQLHYAEKCKVCDYYQHTQGKQLFLDYLPVIVAVFPKAVTITTPVLTRNYSFCLQGYTSRGPPHAFK